MENENHYEKIIDALDLNPHPEGGFYRETYRSEAEVEAFGGEFRDACTAIYFLLPEGVCTDWHRVRSDELWHFYEGSDLILEIVNSEGSFTQLTLGRGATAHSVYQGLVPQNCWQRAYSTGSYSLVGCTVAPGFEFEDFEMINAKELAQRYPNYSSEITGNPFVN